ncbi:MAG: B12-binding domain-containing radical SAM protein, partial [Dehalococcoidia bacterium]|nr:B12-binding domain-containing radical SAM protein [Dehalococcoidia bacterium]
MRTLLNNPPYPFLEFPIIPMGLLYLAAVLEDRDYEVDVLDLLVSRFTKDKIKRKLEEYQPDIVGVTAVTMNYNTASDILKYCKSINPDLITLIGGPHVTFAPKETLDEAPWIDIVIMGEGERTLLDIVDGKKLEQINGIAFRKDGVEVTPQRALIENLDELPLPARHLFPISRYHVLASHCSLVTGRGCPFNCIFCVGSKMGGRRARFRNPKLVVDEIEQGLALGFHEVNIEDDLFTLNHKHLHAICDEIISRGLDFKWSVFARVDTVNPDILQKLRKAGCDWLCYGIESGNQQILDTVKKKITLDRIRESVQMAKDAGVNVLASFILGLPGETRETLQQTVDFARELDTYYGFHVLAPFPGTDVRENADEYGLEILTSDWSKYDANRPVSRTAGASPEDITATLHKYYKGLRIVPDDIEGSDIDQVEMAKSQRRSPLAWALVSNDVIEGLGGIPHHVSPQ